MDLRYVEGKIEIKVVVVVARDNRRKHCPFPLGKSVLHRSPESDCDTFLAALCNH
jgi:hypothetical protein